MSSSLGNNISIPIDVTSFAAGFTGPFSSGQTLTIQGMKINNVVTLTIPTVSATQALGVIVKAIATGCVPASYRPTTDRYIPCTVTIGGALAAVAGKLHIATNGDMEVYAGLTEVVNFSAAAANGWQSHTITYGL